MNSLDMFDALDVIGEESSTTRKVELLRGFLWVPEFREVIIAAYDPLTTFGILAPGVEAKTTFASTFEDHGTMDFLKKLSKRELVGDAAKQSLELMLEKLGRDSGDLLLRILRKDLGCGIGVKLINKAVPNTIYSFPYMRCSLPKQTKVKDWCKNDIMYVQEKMDGMFVNSTVNHEVLFHTRSGQPLPAEKFSSIARTLQRMSSTPRQFHGELLVDVDDVIADRKTGNGILNRVRQGGDFKDGETPILVIWDCVLLPEDGALYRERFGRCSNPQAYDVRQVTHEVVDTFDKALELYNAAILAGKEGVVLKKPSGVWKDGTSRDQVKLKAERVADLRVFKFLPGTGKNESTFGSILCRTDDGDLEVAVSGISDKQRKAFFESDIIGKIISVKFNEVTVDKVTYRHSLFLPRFDCVRDDLEVTDSLDRILML